MTPASEIKEGVEQALRDVLDDDDFLRDMFAAVAVHAFIVSLPPHGFSEVSELRQQATDAAYRVADDMLRARKERWKHKKKG